MSRALTGSMIAAITAGTVRPAILFEGDFASGWLRLWSGVGDLSWGGNTYLGAGQLLGVSSSIESDDLRANGMVVSLSGIPSALVSTALGNARYGKVGRVYLAALVAAGAVITDPYLVFEGRLDVPTIEEGSETATIAITYEGELIDLELVRERRWTHADQQIDYPGDLGFQYVTQIQDAVIQWGLK